MTAQPVDTVLVIAWLVGAHLVADFVLQNDWIATNKATGGSNGWSALGIHGFHVALCLVPVVFAFGGRGLVYLALVTVTHMAVDRWKVRATRDADARAQAAARAALARGAPGSASALGSAWSPWPGMLFLADQALHLAIAIVGWLVILEGSDLLTGFVDFVNAVIRSWDPAVVHATVLTTVVLVSLFIVNTRGAFYFALALVTPRNIRPLPGDDAAPAPAAVDGVSVVPAGASARAAATVAAMERLLIVAFVLSGASVIAGLVVLFDALARFRQLGDREFVEYYLVSMLGSVSVAVGSGLLAAAALQSLGG